MSYTIGTQVNLLELSKERAIFADFPLLKLTGSELDLFRSFSEHTGRVLNLGEIILLDLGFPLFTLPFDESEEFIKFVHTVKVGSAKGILFPVVCKTPIIYQGEEAPIYTICERRQVKEIEKSIGKPIPFPLKSSEEILGGLFRPFIENSLTLGEQAGLRKNN